MGEKSLIELMFPAEEVGKEALREKNIRHGHISTLHIWWARRPLAAMRATIYAALLPTEVGKNDTRNFIARLSMWENSLNHEMLEKARKDILRANRGKPPKVLDCFAGGGSIPLEALRLGCKAYALEYNPVAVLILKATLEFPMHYRQKLFLKVKEWGEWVLRETYKELAEFYPGDEESWVPVGYIWARTIPCQNPQCRAEIPLMRQFWLARKPNKKVALKPIVDEERKVVEFDIVEGDDIDFDPSKGTVKRARATCPVCGTTVPDRKIRELFCEGKAGQRMVAVVLHHSNRRGKRYRLPTEQDLETYERAKKALKRKVEELQERWGMEPVPDEPLPPVGTLGFRVNRYGITKWGDLFNARQKLALLTFAEKLREVRKIMLQKSEDPDFVKAVSTYLGLAVDRLADYNSTLCVWATGEFVAHTFGRQALPMVWDYFELNPFSMSTGDWTSAIAWIAGVLAHLVGIPVVENEPLQALQGSATQLPWPDNFFDAVITDPPYYDNVPYSDLSDFFYVWLKRTIGDLYPDLFLTPLAPKSEELVADIVRRGGSMEEAKRWFEEGLTQAFREIARVMKDDGIAVIIFAHKSTQAWDAIINALLNAGLMMTASWAVKMERKGRLRGQASAALISSVLMVCRKRKQGLVGDYPRVLQELRERIAERLEIFWQQGLKGADFFISAIGPAVEVFGRYERVEKPTGELVSVSELLSEVRRIVAEDALKRILERPNLSGIDPASRFYLLWRWTFNGKMNTAEQETLEEEENEEETGNAQVSRRQRSRIPKVPYDDARLIVQAVVGPKGVKRRDWEQWKFVRITRKQRGTTVQVLPADKRREEEFRHIDTIIDALHYACLLWAQHRYDELKEHLERTYGSTDAFWRYAQALSDILPEGDKERQWLQGLLLWKQVGGRQGGREELQHEKQLNLPFRLCGNHFRGGERE